MFAGVGVVFKLKLGGGERVNPRCMTSHLAPVFSAEAAKFSCCGSVVFCFHHVPHCCAFKLEFGEPQSNSLH